MNRLNANQAHPACDRTQEEGQDLQVSSDDENLGLYATYTNEKHTYKRFIVISTYNTYHTVNACTTVCPKMNPRV